MTDMQNPTGLSDYDFLEFECFVSKVENEGFQYAWENYSPRFETAELNERASTWQGMRALYREYEPAVTAWYKTVGARRACDLHNAHVDEERKRRNDACLWGVRCEDGYVIHEHSREDRDQLVAQMLEGQGNGWRTPVALLSRAVPGGEWTEEPLPTV